MLSFVETMRGTVTEPGGAEHPIEFTVSATPEAPGRFTLRGVARAAPWLPEGEVKGTLTMGLLPPAIDYHLEVGAVTLEARKDPRPWRPLRSMTFMPVVLKSADGAAVAHGTMRFSLRELPKFAASWVFGERQRKQLDAERLRMVRASLERAR